MSNNWIDICKGFAFQKEHYFWEEKCLSFAAAKHRIPFKFFDVAEEVPEDLIPCGRVEWILSVLRKNIEPDYYPKFLSKYLRRKVWKSDSYKENFFVKPADRFKRFNGFIATENSNNNISPPFWISEVVNFQNEWRCYVANGELLGCYWYAGIDESPFAPNEIFSILWPKNLCGAVDFGMLDNGELELVEFHPPFSCGWYGSGGDDAVDIYASWITLGWNWLKNNN